ncbi:MAG: GYD domain-containing protein [Anaerolineales bacterium]|nr:MAG: GYD domain-containing protein [Anaerolineales bacterium]
MAKYLVQAAYTDAGLEGLLKEGGSRRRDAVGKAVKSLGGTLEAFYYAFGDADVVGIVDLPDNVSAAAFSLLVNAAGGAAVQTTVLMTPEEVDQATKKTLDYRAPGE